MKPFITTYSGKHICPLNIQVQDIELEDIARGLSNTCRFGGQLRHFYSVAQHSVLCYELSKKLNNDDSINLACLLHDSSESITGDQLAPIKGNMAISTMPDGKIVSINQLEDQILDAINKKLYLNLNYHHPSVKYIDRVLLNSESFYLRGFKVTEDLPILIDRIIPLNPKDAYIQFIAACKEMGLVSLTPELVDAAFSC